MFQLRLAGADKGAALAIGALQFTKGLSQYLSATDAEVQAAQIHAINANASEYDDEGHCTNFVQRYVVEIVPVETATAEAAEDAADVAASADALANPERIPFAEVKRQLDLDE